MAQPDIDADGVIEFSCGPCALPNAMRAQASVARSGDALRRSVPLPRNGAKLRQPADPGEWRIDPQIVGAVIVFTPNTETFSAGLLQPPYFDSQGDAAFNYGSAGAGIAHEISHSFDELGNIYDDQGRLGMWWTPEDLAKYHVATAKLATQFDGYCPLPNLCADGKRVLSENVADLAGLLTRMMPTSCH